MLGTGAELKFETRSPIMDTLLGNPDPLGEVIVQVPEPAVDEYATVLALEFGPGA